MFKAFRNNVYSIPFLAKTYSIHSNELELVTFGLMIVPFFYDIFTVLDLYSLFFAKTYRMMYLYLFYLFFSIRKNLFYFGFVFFLHHWCNNWFSMLCFSVCSLLAMLLLVYILKDCTYNYHSFTYTLTRSGRIHS